MGLKMYTFFEQLFILYRHICETTPIFSLMSKNCVFKIKIHNFFVISNGASCLWGELSWGEWSGTKLPTSHSQMISAKKSDGNNAHQTCMSMQVCYT
jgi:hypothetical protein